MNTDNFKNQIKSLVGDTNIYVKVNPNLKKP